MSARDLLTDTLAPHRFAGGPPLGATWSAVTFDGVCLGCTWSGQFREFAQHLADTALDALTEQVTP